MTAFDKTQLPQAVDTLEKLIIWSTAAFNKNNKAVTAIEGSGSPQRVAQFGIFNVETNNTSRVIARVSLELEETFAIDGKPIWENAKELSADVISSEFLP